MIKMEKFNSLFKMFVVDLNKVAQIFNQLYQIDKLNYTHKNQSRDDWMK